MPVRKAVLILACFLGAAGGQTVAAQGRQGPRAGGPPGNPDGALVSPAEIQRMFDSYALMQAQEQLKIADDKFPQFLTRFKALQDVRRRGLNERARAIVELRRLVNDAQGDEAAIKDRLKALDELEARNDAEMKKAYDALNQVLDVRQQAKFRVFEENMERRKLELVNRARQANRKPPL
jgi:Spy/CpxP family protein refolding chaperone